jgi:hypothetical protein
MVIINEKKSQTYLADPVLWGVFILYIIVLSVTIYHHELWGDEIHSWNIAKGSKSFGDLILNTRYEGHPPVWYAILWVLSKFTHDLTYVQLVHGIFAGLIVFMVLFFSPFPFSTKILIPFGYYFLYEYAVLSRNYAIAVLIAFCICLLMHKNFKYKTLSYYFLLFLLSNTHLIALLLAVSIHLYFLLLQIERRKRKTELALHILAGGLIFLSSLYFIFPPADSELNVRFWMNRWNIQQIKAVIQLPLRAFIPVPAWWDNHFWNTEFLLEAKNKYKLLKYINPLILLMLLGVVYFILRKNKKSLALFTANILMSFIIAITLFALGTARYSGFIFIGFVVAYWLSSYDAPQNDRNKWLVNMLLMFQIAGSIFAIVKDIQLPFSNAYRVNELLKEIPENEKAVTDYWALNAISAFADKPFYCVDLQKEKSFILWDKDLADSQKKPNRYYEGINNFFNVERVQKLYMISTESPENLFKVDAKLSTSFRVALVDKREGAIEKGSDFYLYQISTY